MFLSASTEMDTNCDTFIKQEFMNDDEELLNNINDADPNISIKNELIFDESFSSVTIKSALNPETTFFKGIETESENDLQGQEVVTDDKNKFLIYNVDTSHRGYNPPSFLKRKDENVLPAISDIHTSNITQNKDFLKTNGRALLSSLHKKNMKNVTISTATDSAPILLNTQFRKRHAIISQTNPIDKRTRYNIAGTTTKITADKNDAAADYADASHKYPLINTGSKKIINHFIKHKKRQQVENIVPSGSTAITKKPDYQDTEKTFASTIKIESLSPAPTNHLNQIAVSPHSQSNLINTVSASSSVPLLINQKSIQSTRRLTANSPIVSELRVKCLCSLTADTSTAGLKDFFNEMFEETRRLDKADQRKIKKLLLEAICAAEESMERGKCCGF